MKASKTFRVFVSSTFSDMKAERNALQSRVFPELARFCRERGSRFQPIDLRWGISSEATHDHRAMEICLNEIGRSQRISPKPNFIVLLGDRYGWRPLPPRIPGNEFALIEDALRQQGKSSDLDILAGWYIRDDNSRPTEWTLRAREGIYREEKEWNAIEAILCRVLLDGIKDLPLGHAEQIKYYASATEQEIIRGAMAADKAHEHVLIYFRNISNPQITAGAGAYFDLDSNGRLLEDTRKRQIALKDELRRRFPRNVKEFSAQLTPNGCTQSHIDDLCADVEATLKAIILDELEKAGTQDEQEAEASAHERFGAERRRCFTGRDDALKAIEEYITGESNKPFVICGPGGSGKSALMAKSVWDVRKERLNAVVIKRYIGATPHLNHIQRLAENLRSTIFKEYGQVAGPSPDKMNISEQLEGLMKAATPDKPLILYLDALDQLSAEENAHAMNWLPFRLPPNVKIILSALEGSEPHKALNRRKVDIASLAPLANDESRDLLRTWLHMEKRTLQPGQEEEVLRKSSGSPLHLKLAFEEARLWKSYDAPEKNVIAETVDEMIEQLFARLSTNENHGAPMVAGAVGYLAASRNGLAEDELLDVLSADDAVMSWFKRVSWHDLPGDGAAPRLPVAPWARLFADLEPYIGERATDGTYLYMFFHRIFQETAERKYLAGAQDGKLFHSRLGDYFRAQPLSYTGESVLNPNIRKTAELPYQLTLCERWDDVTNVLCGLDFIETKVAAGGTYDLAGDYKRLFDTLPELEKESREEQRWTERMERWTREIVEYSAKWSAAWDKNGEEPDKYPMPSEKDIPLPEIPQSITPYSAERVAEDIKRIMENPGRKDMIKAFADFVGENAYSLAKYSKQPGFVLAHAYNMNRNGPVGEKAAEAVKGGWLKAPAMLFRKYSRKEYNAQSPILKKLEGHNSFVTAVALSQNGSIALTSADNHRMMLWDVKTGKCLNIIEGYQFIASPSYWVRAIKIIAGDKIAFTAGGNGSLLQWSLDSGECIKTLSGHSGPINTLSSTYDGRFILTGGDDKTIRLWDLKTGGDPKVLHGHTDKVNSVVLSANGKYAISGSGDKTIRVWDLYKGCCVMTITGHDGEVESVAISRNGKTIVSASSDETIRIWESSSGKCVKVINSNVVNNSVEISADGRYVIYPQRDGVVLWDMIMNEYRYMEIENYEREHHISITDDGRYCIIGKDDHEIVILDSKYSINKKIGIDCGNNEDYWYPSENNIQSIAVISNGKYALSVGNFNELKRWDLESGSCVNSQTQERWFKCDYIYIMPDDKHAIINEYNQVMMINYLNCNTIHTFEDVRSDRALIITPSGDHLIAVGENKRNKSEDIIKYVNIESGKCIATATVSIGTSNSEEMPVKTRDCIAITRDCKWAAIARSYSDKSEELIIWSICDGTVKTIWHNQRKRKYDKDDYIIYVYSPIAIVDDRYVVSCGYCGNLNIWDYASGKMTEFLSGHDGVIMYMKMSDNGRYAFTAGLDKTIRMWDIQNISKSGIVISTVLSKTQVIAVNGNTIVFSQGSNVLAGDIVNAIMI